VGSGVCRIFRLTPPPRSCVPLPLWPLFFPSIVQQAPPQGAVSPRIFNLTSLRSL